MGEAFDRLLSTIGDDIKKASLRKIAEESSFRAHLCEWSASADEFLLHWMLEDEDRVGLLYRLLKQRWKKLQ